MKIKEQFLIREIGGEYVIVCNENDEINFSRVIGLNRSAAFLVKSAGHSDFDVIAWTHLLIDRFKIDYQKAKSDAEKLIDRLKREEIIE